MPDAKLETTDDMLLGGTVHFRQPAEGYRAAIDPVLLAAAVPDSVTGKVLDLGCGAGAAMLCLARRRADLTVVGLERDKDLAELARYNAKANGFEERVTALAGDLLRPPPAIGNGSFDAVIANPPYLDAESADPSPNPKKAAATVESEADIVAWTQAAARFVNPKQGAVLFIYRADRLAELRAGLEKAGCGGFVTVPLWPKIGTQPKRMIILARRGDKSPPRGGTGLVLHDPNGHYTPQADSILRNGVKLTI